MEKTLRNFWRNLCAGALTLGMSATAVMPVSAMPQPIAPPLPIAAPGDVQLAQFVDQREVRRLRRADRRIDRRIERRDARRYSREFQRRGDRYYYRGYRGYRYARPGYRYYNGYYFPGSAFIAGAIIGGALNSGVRPRGSAHVNWCVNRYRSYRVSDNTFQPNSGPRRQCNSPYN